MSSIRNSAVFLGSLILYFVCLDRGASLWDCPEYILVAWRLEVGHPPGNPTWQLLANVVSHLFADAAHAALVINALSAIAMALASTVLSAVIFIFIRTAFFRGSGRQPLVWANVCTASGALCYAWCDSAIFSAVEAEVYALSVLLTIVMLYLALRWARLRREGRVAASRRLFILTAYLAGLGAGVHELNFLILPAMALVYFYGWRKCGGWLPTALWSFMLFLIGTTTYLIIPIRAAANPPVNTGNPSSPAAFKSYLLRDQYAKKPLLYGKSPYSLPLREESYDSVSGLYSYNRYFLTENSAGGKEYVYPDQLNVWFPRMTGSSPSDIEFYEAWAGMTPDAMEKVMVPEAVDSAGRQVGRVNPATGSRELTESYRPTFLQQLRFMAAYQVGFMYFRYLLWNFSGRQNNVRGGGGPDNGNFITGFPVIDNAMLGDQEALPVSLREANPGFNRYYLIPFIFGIAGIVALCRSGRRGRRLCLINTLFFLFTGVLIVIYLNQDPGEPRDRDYSFLGSYMAFCVWIACGLAAFVRFILRAAPKGNRSARQAGAVAAVLVCVGVPLQMLSQTCDDHNRSRRTGADEMASMLFEGVEPGAIVFANGDNAIFPLWYAQEVLGLRRDVSVVAIPYLSADWYRRQLRREGEGAPALEVADSIPGGSGTPAERIISDIIKRNPGRAAYRALPGSISPVESADSTASL